MPTATFTADYERIAEAQSDSGVANTMSSLDTTIEMGEDGKLAGPEARSALAAIYDLNQFGGIPENAILTDVKLKVTPTGTIIGATPGDVDHRFALMASNGGWDRSPQNDLHSDITGIVMGNPSRRDSITVRGFNEAETELFITQNAGAGHHTITTSATIPNLGTTFKLEAGEELKHIEFFINRTPGDGTSTDLIYPQLYELAGDGRHFAVDSKITGTIVLPTSYGALPSTGAWFRFTCFLPLPSVAHDRWLGVLFDGGAVTPTWFTSGVSATTKRINMLANSLDDDLSYRVLTDGSFFTAGLYNVNTLKDNCLHAVAYPYDGDIPHIYTNATTTELTTPFKRYKGNILASDDSAVTWFTGTPHFAYNYGSPTSGQLNEFPNIVAEIQSHLDGSDYDLATGKTFIGVLLDVKDPDEQMWPSANYSHPSLAAMQLILTWDEPPVITSTAITIGEVGAQYYYDVEATDIDLQVLTWSLDISPSGMTINSSTGEIVWTPSVGQIGVHAVTVKVTDTPLLLTDTQSFNITVSWHISGPIISNALSKDRHETRAEAIDRIIAANPDIIDRIETSDVKLGLRIRTAGSKAKDRIISLLAHARTRKL